MNEEQDIKSANNIQNEMCLVGSLFKSPDLYISYGNFMRSKYDFSDEATRFFYNMFELMYTTFSQTIDENKLNIFMSQNDDRLRIYKRYKGWKTVSQWMSLADANDFKNYYETVKKYSLVREYERNGYPVQKILNHTSFDKWKAQDIYKIIRSKADKINTVISASEESIVLNDKNTALVNTYLSKPRMGEPFPWAMYNEMFLGCRLGKVVFQGFLSNEGKSRNLMLLAAYLVLIREDKFLLLSNEMDEEDLRSCLITTVINNPEFQEYHGVKINKPEKEIVLGLYKDNKGNYIKRLIDDGGNYMETEEQFISRLQEISEEYKQVIAVSEWIDAKREGKLFFKDVGTDYSDENLEFECRKHKMVYGVDYCGYDTLKGYQTDEWSTIKQTATKLKELMKEIHMFGFMPFQLTDDTVFTDIFQLSSNNIANCKGIKHIVDILTLGKKIYPEEYFKYQYMSLDDWGEPATHNLNNLLQYFAIKADKNRSGDKSKIMLFEINLDYNVWKNIGWLIKRPKINVE